MLAKGLPVSIYFPNTPATFIHIPRTGGTSFKSWAKTNIPSSQELPLPDFIPSNTNIIPNRQHLVSVWGNLGTEFAFVRNPYDRLVSLYHYMGQWAEQRFADNKNKLATGVDFVKTFPYQSSNAITAIQDDKRLIDYYNLGFENWLNSVFYNRDDIYSKTGHGTRHIIDHFWRGETQLSWFNGQLPDVIIKTEELDTEFYIIQNLLNCHVPLPIENSSRHDHYQAYYNSSTKKLVETVFAEDLAAFEYKF